LGGKKEGEHRDPGKTWKRDNSGGKEKTRLGFEGRTEQLTSGTWGEGEESQRCEKGSDREKGYHWEKKDRNEEPVW